MGQGRGDNTWVKVESGTWNRENKTRVTLVKELFKPNEDAMSVANFKTLVPCSEDLEVSSPLKHKKEAIKNG